VTLPHFYKLKTKFMKQIAFLLALCMASIAHYQCNPACINLTNVRTNSSLAPAGYEILITADQTEDLRGRGVRFGSTQATDSRFIDGLGLAVKVPLGISSPVAIMIDDPDCGDVMVSDQFALANSIQSSFGTANYVFPMPPEIVIPNPPITLPTSIDNAWFQPDNAEYCIWIKALRIVKAPGDTLVTTQIDPAQSEELSTCLAKNLQVPVPNYHKNPVSGVFDIKNNYIRFIIDRTSKGLGYEEFEGTLIEKSMSPYATKTKGPFLCGTQPTEVPLGNAALLVTSLTTGRQLILIH
jgi:hypothetical protein